MSPLPFSSPPERLCLLRLSALGDISHALPLVRAIQDQWPATQLSWIIGKGEYALVSDIPGIDFIIFDKGRRWRAFAALRKQLAGRRFDALLHMQMSLRASLISTLVKAEVRLGFDRERAKDLQWLFTNARIPHTPRQHVLESFLSFGQALGLATQPPRWDIPIPETARAFAREQLPATGRILAISPCSSMAYRNWHAAGYAAVADYAAEHGMQVVLVGGNRPIERQMGAEISTRMAHTPLNLIGVTELKQLLAILERADGLLAPDSGPAHLATAVGTPVIGLYACTNPERARPYLSAEYVVNRYPEAVQAKYGKMPDALPWGIRVKDAGTMERIGVEDVIEKLDLLLHRIPA